jgi:CheY-like chemotaxis protein
MSGLAGARVLVADDYPLIASLLRQTFEDAGCEVVVETAADRVAEVAARERPDLAIVDAHMQPCERFHALQELHDLDGERHLAIIVISGDDEPALRRRAIELGADAFLAKPWDHDELLDLAERLTARR